MQVTDMLAQMGGLQAMARELGVSETQAARGADALLPALLGGFKKQTQAQPAGLDGLSGLLDDVLAPPPTDVRRGHDVLGQIFGSQDVSRAVAQDAAARSELAPALLKKMLPLLAMLVAGYLAKQPGAGTDATPSSAGSGLGGQAAGAGSTTPGAAGGGLAAMLDLDGDGNPLDDILRMLGQAIR